MKKWHHFRNLDRLQSDGLITCASAEAFVTNEVDEHDGANGHLDFLLMTKCSGSLECFGHLE